MEAKEILALGGGLVLGSIAIGPVARMVNGAQVTPGQAANVAVWSGAIVAGIGLAINHYTKSGIGQDLAVGGALAGGLIGVSGLIVKFAPPPASQQAAGALPHKLLHALNIGGASMVERSATQKIAAWQSGLGGSPDGSGEGGGNRPSISHQQQAANSRGRLGSAVSAPQWAQQRAPSVSHQQQAATSRRSGFLNWQNQPV